MKNCIQFRRGKLGSSFLPSFLPSFRRLGLILLLVPVIGIGLLAQTTSAFSIVSPYSTLNADQSKIVNIATTKGISGTLQYLNWSTGDVVGSDGKIRITLPSENGGQQMVFDVVGYFIENSTTYAVSGKSNLGQVAIFSSTLGKMGTIILGSGTYDLLPMSEYGGIIFKKAPDTSNEGQCTQTGEGSTVQAYCNGDCGSSTIDILFMVTPEADQWLKDTYGIFSWVALFSEANKFNLALANSEIPNKQGRFRFIKYTPQDFVPSSIGEQDPVTGIPGLPNQLKNSAHANQTLQDNGADIGVYLTPNFNHFGLTGNHVVTGSPKFSVVLMGQGPMTNITIAHEIAHNFGCEHGYATPTNECTNGKLLPIVGADDKGTIMAPAGSDRILNYSNPDVPFMGNVMTGDDGSNGEPIRNNAARIKAAMCEVANNNTPTFFGTDYTYFFNEQSNCGVFTANASVDPGMQQFGDVLIACPGSYTYEWSWSATLAGTFQTIGGNSSTLTLPASPNCPWFYLKVKVTAGSCSVEKIKHIHCIICPRSGVNEDLVDIKGYQLKVIPNPASDIIRIALDEETDAQRVFAIGSNGQSVIELKPVISEGVLSIDISRLSNGLWFLKLIGAEGETTLKFVVAR